MMFRGWHSFYFLLGPNNLTVTKKAVCGRSTTIYGPGEIISIYKDGIGVMCKDKEIIITKVKPSGKKEMNVKDYLNGKQNQTLEGRILC